MSLPALRSLTGPFPRVLQAPWALRARHLTDYSAKYASKLVERAEQEGLSVDALRARVKEAEQAAARERLARAKEAETRSASLDGPKAATTVGARKNAARRDSSPVKPLDAILNVPRILETPHTPEQVAALWTARHAARTGALCAAVPRAAYENMLRAASRYPQFVLPLARGEQEDGKKAYEFFLLQWDIYGAPADPSVQLGDAVSSSSPSPDAHESLPRVATAIFAPLGEYKLRQSFAAPHLALTFHSDLARTHGLVLLRGELTPRAADPAKFLLSQAEAQMLAMGLQRFYLWGGETGEEREELLRTFHERPDAFRWEELVRLGDVLA